MADRLHHGEMGESRAADAARALVEFTERDNELRLELAQLRQKLADVQRDLERNNSTELREANAELVMATLQAERLIEDAMKEHSLLDAAHSAAVEALREVNERLLLAALASKEYEEHEEDKHRRQEKFVAMVAHELRDPLNPIRMVAGLLKRASGDEAMLTNLQHIIERQVASMAQLIDDLLDQSRGGAGKFRLAADIVDINTVLRLSIETTTAAIEARGQDLHVRLPNKPVNVKGDLVRLAQIFSNLLGNASKYTPQGGRISLSASLDGGFVSVTVADNGIGIPQEILPHVFELFVQEDRAHTVNQGGLGIGLAVVQELIEAHGGTITAHSAGKDLGSEFTVRLPISQRVN